MFFGRDIKDYPDLYGDVNRGAAQNVRPDIKDYPDLYGDVNSMNYSCRKKRIKDYPDLYGDVNFRVSERSRCFFHFSFTLSIKSAFTSNDCS